MKKVIAQTVAIISALVFIPIASLIDGSEPVINPTIWQQIADGFVVTSFMLFLLAFIVSVVILVVGFLKENYWHSSKPC